MSTKKRVGLILFWMSIAYMVAIGWFGDWSFGSTFRSLSLEEIDGTAWAFNKPLFWLWAFSIPFGSILASLGILLYAGSKSIHVWLIVLGMLVVLRLIQLLPGKTHYPQVFGAVGGLILVSFLLLLWFWARKRAILEGHVKTAADLRLVGYVFLIIAMWNICGTLGAQHYQALSSMEQRTPVALILYLGAGWLFLLLGQYKEAKALQDEGTD